MRLPNRAVGHPFAPRTWRGRAGAVRIVPKPGTIVREPWRGRTRTRSVGLASQLDESTAGRPLVSESPPLLPETPERLGARIVEFQHVLLDGEEAER
jgi:hypothetical protein